jgi:hypothetical protein
MHAHNHNQRINDDYFQYKNHKTNKAQNPSILLTQRLSFVKFLSRNTNQKNSFTFSGILQSQINSPIQIHTTKIKKIDIEKQQYKPQTNVVAKQQNPLVNSVEPVALYTKSEISPFEQC